MRLSKRIPNMVTFVATSFSSYDEKLKVTAEVVLVGDHLHFSSRDSSSSVSIAWRTAALGNWVYAIMQAGWLNHNWNESVLDLVYQIRFWCDTAARMNATAERIEKKRR